MKTLIIALTCILTALVLSAPVVAATPAEPEIVPCLAINSAGLIVIYRCQPDEGASYLINSLGFMLFEE